MPDLLEHMYSAHQINISPNLPYILKQYAKAAIRTQPYDLLYWSAAYFRAKANDTPPPVKERLEYPPFDSPSRLSPGFLKVLHNQLGGDESVPAQELYDRWLGVCLVKESLDSMLEIGELNLTNELPWLKFVAVAAGHICTSLSKTMVLICEVLTKEPEGGSAMIPVEVFVKLYQFLARLDCGPDTYEVVAPTDDLECSLISRSTNVSMFSERMDCVHPGPKTVEEKDSNAGLMVWEDLKPEEIEERMLSPKYTDEPGASSELGLEVLDDAIGPVVESVTILPAQPTTPVGSSPFPQIPLPSVVPRRLDISNEENEPSHASLEENSDWLQIKPRTVDPVGSSPFPQIPLPSVVPRRVDISNEENEPSHTSLEENADWLQIKPRTVDERVGSSEGLVPASDSTSVVDVQALVPRAAAEDDVSEAEKTLDSNPEEIQEAKEDFKNVELSLEERAVEEKTEGAEPSLVERTEEVKIEEGDDLSLKERAVEQGIEGTELPLEERSELPLEEQTELPLEERTELPLEERTEEENNEEENNEEAESIKEIISTKEISKSNVLEEQSSQDSEFDINERKFIADKDRRPTTLSSLEIRKGFVGENPGDFIERTSSENTVTAEETVIQMGPSEYESTECFYQGEIIEQSKASKSEKSSSDSEFAASKVLRKEIPGIGPVIPEPQILAVVEYMQYWAGKQCGCIMPRNIYHPLCPPLDLPPAPEPAVMSK